MPGVVGNVRCLGGVGIGAADSRWSKEPLHALDITSRRAKVCVHIAATDPLCARRHPDLVPRSVITDHGAGGMRPVRLVIARKRRIVSAGITDAVMDRIVPVIIVIGILAVPPAVMRLERVMCPALAGIRIGDNNSLSVEPERPYLRRVRVIDARFNRGRPLEA